MLARRHPPSGHRAHCDRDRLDERGERRIEVADGEDLRGWEHEPLLERAVRVDARQGDPHAGIATPEPAWITTTAGPDGPDRDPHPRREVVGRVRPELDDSRRRLVTLDPRIQRRGVLDRADVAEEVVEVRAAEADCLGSDQHLAGAGRSRLLDAGHLHQAPTPRHRRSHLPHPGIESRREWKCNGRPKPPGQYDCQLSTRQRAKERHA